MNVKNIFTFNSHDLHGAIFFHILEREANWIIKRNKVQTSKKQVYRIHPIMHPFILRIEFIYQEFNLQMATKSVWFV